MNEEAREAPRETRAFNSSRSLTPANEPRAFPRVDAAVVAASRARRVASFFSREARASTNDESMRSRVGVACHRPSVEGQCAGGVRGRRDALGAFRHGSRRVLLHSGGHQSRQRRVRLRQRRGHQGEKDEQPWVGREIRVPARLPHDMNSPANRLPRRRRVMNSLLTGPTCDLSISNRHARAR